MNDRRQIPVVVRLVLTALAMIVWLVPVTMLVLLPGPVFFLVGLFTVPVVGGFIYSRFGPAHSDWRSASRPSALAIGSMVAVAWFFLIALCMTVTLLFSDALVHMDFTDERAQVTEGFRLVLWIAGWIAVQFVVAGALGGAGGLIDFARRRNTDDGWNDAAAGDTRKGMNVDRLDPWA